MVMALYQVKESRPLSGSLKIIQILNSTFILKALTFYHCHHLRASIIPISEILPLLICHLKC